MTPRAKDYMITSEVIDQLYTAISFAEHGGLFTAEKYMQVRHVVDELAQTHQDGTLEPQEGDDERDAVSAAYERWQAGEKAYQVARRERQVAREVYRQALDGLDPDDARADLDRRISQAGTRINRVRDEGMPFRESGGIGS